MTEKFQGIQSLRGFAAIAVLLHHIEVMVGKEKYFGETLFGNLGDAGFRGVDLFFVVSGFIMMHTVSSRKNQVSSFVQNRLIRIFLPYLPIMLLLTALYFVLPQLAQGGAKNDAWHLFLNIFLLPRADLSTYVPVVAWTLTYELTFYLIFAVTFIRGGAAGVAFFVIWMLAVVINIWVGSEIYILDSLNLGFGFGIVSYVLSQKLSINNRLNGAFFFISCLLFLSLMIVSGGSHEVLAYDLSFLLLSALLCTFSGIIGKGFFAKVGDFSYSLYLTHYPVVAFVFVVSFRSPLSEWFGVYGVVLLALVFCFVIAWTYFLIFERLFYSKVRGYFSRRKRFSETSRRT